MRIVSCLLLVVLCGLHNVDAQPRIESQFRIARLKYSGGRDWYNGPTEEVNLLKFVQQNTNIDCDPRYEFVDLSSDKLFSYPFLFITGHGNISFSDYEVQRLRSYFQQGGFLYADDDYGMDKAFRREIKKVFPDQELAELPFSYGLYHCHFDFPNGVPKRMNTMVNHRRDSGCSLKAGLSSIIHMSRIQATAGMIRKCMAIRNRCDRKHCDLEQILSFGR